MSQRITIDILRLTFLVPAELLEAETRTIARTLGSRKFAATVCRLVRNSLANEPRLKKVRVELSH